MNITKWLTDSVSFSLKAAHYAFITPIRPFKKLNDYISDLALRETISSSLYFTIYLSLKPFYLAAIFCGVVGAIVTAPFGFVLGGILSVIDSYDTKLIDSKKIEKTKLKIDDLNINLTTDEKTKLVSNIVISYARHHGTNARRFKENNVMHLSELVLVPAAKHKPTKLVLKSTWGNAWTNITRFFNEKNRTGAYENNGTLLYDIIQKEVERTYRVKQLVSRVENTLKEIRKVPSLFQTKTANELANHRFPDDAAIIGSTKNEHDEYHRNQKLKAF